MCGGQVQWKDQGIGLRVKASLLARPFEGNLTASFIALGRSSGAASIESEPDGNHDAIARDNDFLCPEVDAHENARTPASQD